MKPCRASSATQGKDERGAVFLEFLFLFGTFVALFLFFVDLMHYMAIRAALLKGAQDALSVAVVDEDLQVDLSKEGDGSDGHSAFTAALTNASHIAARISTSVFLSDPQSDPDALAVIKNFKFVSKLEDGSDWESADLPALIIRPGDEGDFSDPNCSSGGPGRDISHPRPRQTGESMESALRSRPIIVKLAAHKKMFTPFVNPVLIEAAAVGWVQQFPKAGYNISQFINPTPGGGNVCQQPPSCTNWRQSGCRCCDTPANSCANGGSWNTDPSVCGCQCPAACPAGTVRIYDCSCVTTGGGSGPGI